MKKDTIHLSIIYGNWSLLNLLRCISENMLVFKKNYSINKWYIIKYKNKKIFPMFRLCKNMKNAIIKILIFPETTVLSKIVTI